MNVDRKPLPRFWYFPRDEKAAVVMTGDDHGNGGTAGRFDRVRRRLGPPGCSVADWECIRGTSYIYPNTPRSPTAQATAYPSAPASRSPCTRLTGCADWTDHAELESFYATSSTASPPTTPACPPRPPAAPTASPGATGRRQPKVELENGIRLDTNYYYWPPGLGRRTARACSPAPACRCASPTSTAR